MSPPHDLLQTLKLRLCFLSRSFLKNHEQDLGVRDQNFFEVVVDTMRAPLNFSYCHCLLNETLGLRSFHVIKKCGEIEQPLPA